MFSLLEKMTCRSVYNQPASIVCLEWTILCLIISTMLELSALKILWEMI